MLPPEKDEEPDKKGGGADTSPDADSPEGPKPATGRRRRKSSESQAEEGAVAGKPEGRAGAAEKPSPGGAAAEDTTTTPEDTATSSVEATPDAGDDGQPAAAPPGTKGETSVVEAPPSDQQAEQRHAGEDPGRGREHGETAARGGHAPPPPPGRSGGWFLPSLVAAIIGGLIGAGGIWYYLQRQDPPGPDPEITAALEQQGGEVSDLAERLAAIEGDVGSLNEALSASDVGDAIDQLRMESEGRFDELTQALADAAERAQAAETRLEQADARIEELEARPIADPETANQVLRSEVADMRQEVEQATEAARGQVETMRTELATVAEETQAQILAAEERAAELEAQAQERIEQAEAEAEAIARAAEAEAALAQIQAAIDSGEPFPDVLSTLQENAEQSVPEALASAAETGVPTLAELRAAYPDAARAALQATAVASTEGEPANRLVAFLRTQTQARSLTPREGDSPDAVLSRAEAALTDGDVSAALAELEALPEEGREAMRDWIGDARQRAEAVEAAETLRQDMN